MFVETIDSPGVATNIDADMTWSDYEIEPGQTMCMFDDLDAPGNRYWEPIPVPNGRRIRFTWTATMLGTVSSGSTRRGRLELLLGTWTAPKEDTIRWRLATKVCSFGYEEGSSFEAGGRNFTFDDVLDFLSDNSNEYAFRVALVDTLAGARVSFVLRVTAF